MELGEVSDVVRSYPWRCIECKICEICQEKGDDVCYTTNPLSHTFTELATESHIVL
jgi:hypothetical protein